MHDARVVGFSPATRSGRPKPGPSREFRRSLGVLGYRKGFVQRDGALGNSVGEGWALDQLQHQCPRVVGFLDAVDGSNTWMIQTGEDLGFALEPGQSVRIRCKRLRQDLKRHLAVGAWYLWLDRPDPYPPRR